MLIMSSRGSDTTEPGAEWRRIFAQWLDEGLRRRGLRVQELAKRLNLDPSRLSKMRRGNRRVLQHEIPIIEEYLGETAPKIDADGNITAAGTKSEFEPKWVTVQGIAEAGVFSERGARKPRTARYSLLQPNVAVDLLFYEIQGDCLDGFPHGTLLICIPMEQAGLQIEAGGVYIVERMIHQGDKTLIETSPRRAHINKTHIEFRCSDSTRHPAITVPLRYDNNSDSDVKIVGVVWRAVREIMNIPLLTPAV